MCSPPFRQVCAWSVRIPSVMFWRDWGDPQDLCLFLMAFTCLRARGKLASRCRGRPTPCVLGRVRRNHALRGRARPTPCAWDRARQKLASRGQARLTPCAWGRATRSEVPPGFVLVGRDYGCRGWALALTTVD